MLYIISGTSRSGKTLIAKQMMKQSGISYLSLDWLMMGFTNGIPEYGIHDKLWPDEIARKMWPFLEAMFKNMLWAKEDCVIDGEAILPSLIDKLIQKYPRDVRVCFVGYTSISVDEKVKEVYEHSNGKSDWLTNEPRAYVEDHIGNMIAYSKQIKIACKKYNMKYIDTSKEFLPSLSEAANYLLKVNET